MNPLFFRENPALAPRAPWPYVGALLCSLVLAGLTTVCAPGIVAAQAEHHDEEVVPGQGRRYAWGEGGGGSEQGPARAATRRFARVFGTIGAGGSLRLYYDDVALHQDLAGPVYLQLRGAYFFEGEGDLQHGVGLGIATNLTADPMDLSYADGFFELGQWTLAPSYYLRVFIDDAFQILGSFGVPVGISGTYQTIGLELAGGIVYEILAGFGIYAHITLSTYFAAFVQPMLSGDLGLVFDYEVLP